MNNIKNLLLELNLESNDNVIGLYELSVLKAWELLEQDDTSVNTTFKSFVSEGYSLEVLQATNENMNSWDNRD